MVSPHHFQDRSRSPCGSSRPRWPALRGGSALASAPGPRPSCGQDLGHLPSSAFVTLTWREGANIPLTSRFAALRVRPAARGATLRPVEWLLVEWPEGEAEPTGYWLSTLPQDIVLTALVDLAKLRWRIERDQELKSELGPLRGRGWREFHTMRPSPSQLTAS